MLLQLLGARSITPTAAGGDRGAGLLRRLDDRARLLAGLADDCVGFVGVLSVFIRTFHVDRSNFPLVM